MPRIHILRGAASVALTATVLAACGSSVPAAAPGGGQVPSPTQVAASSARPQPAGGGSELGGATGLCAIFPADRAAAALGEPVGSGTATHSTTFANASCHYDSTASDASITIWYHPGLTRDEWERSMAKIGMSSQMSVAGIGEAAYRRDGSASHPQVKLAAFQGDHDVWVIIAKAGDLGALAATAEREARDLLAAVG